MSSVRVHPRRSVRYEIISLVSILVLPVTLFVVFPYESIGFEPSKKLDAANAPLCAFVNLTEAQEREALAAAKTSWQVDAEGVRHLRMDLSAGELKATPLEPVMKSRPPRQMRRAAESYDLDVLPPTVAAPAPVKIEKETESDSVKAVFSREELLKLD